MPDPHAKKVFATEVLKTLRDRGFTALWAGGCVRDLLLGLEPSDYDVATDATPDQVMRIFRRTVPVGVSFGVVRVLGPKPAGEIEVATFRSDLAYVDGRRPEGVVFSSPRQDAERRDFTINGMFYDPISGEVIDYVGGRADLDARVLRAIGDATARFEEDKLRLLRAVRFAARFGLVIEPATRQAMIAMANEVRVVAPERIAMELRKILVHPSRVHGLTLAMEISVLLAILPSLSWLRGAAAGAETGSVDLWDHTLRVLGKLPESPSVTLATAALLHAVGDDRPEPKASLDERAGTAAEVARVVCRELRYANPERDRVVWLVQHQRALRDAPTMPRSRLKRLLSQPGIAELIELHRAIAEAIGEPADHVEYARTYLRDQPEGPIDPPALLTGDDLKAIGLTPGPRFKAILEEIRDAQLEGRIRTPDEAIDLAKEMS